MYVSIRNYPPERPPRHLSPPRLRDRARTTNLPHRPQRGLVGNIITRFENKGFQLKALKLYQTPREVAEEHYKDLSSKARGAYIPLALCRWPLYHPRPPPSTPPTHPHHPSHPAPVSPFTATSSTTSVVAPSCAWSGVAKGWSRAPAR